MRFVAAMRAKTRRRSKRSCKARSTSARDAVILNAAATIHVAADMTLNDAAARAAHAIDSGEAGRTLTRWREMAKRASAGGSK